MPDVRGRHTADRCRHRLTAILVIKLDLPAPLLAIVGVPPALEDAGLPSGKDHDSTDVLFGGPAVFQRDGASATNEVAHRAGLMTLEPIPRGYDIARAVEDLHLQFLGGGIDENPIPYVIGVHARPGKGEPRGAWPGKPEVPG